MAFAKILRGAGDEKQSRNAKIEDKNPHIVGDLQKKIIFALKKKKKKDKRSLLKLKVKISQIILELQKIHQN